MNHKELINDFNKKYNHTLTESDLCNYENNLTIPLLRVFIDLADYFNVSMSYLLDNEHELDSLKEKLQERQNTDKVDSTNETPIDFLELIENLITKCSNADEITVYGDPLSPSATNELLSTLNTNIDCMKSEVLRLQKKFKYR